MTEPYTGLTAVLSVGALIIGLAWLFLPFLVLSKMGEILKELRQTRKVLSDEYHALDQIRANTAPLANANVEYQEHAS